MDIAELVAEVRYLRDRQDILDVLHRYARGIDRLDRELVLSAYHPDAIDEHGAYAGPAAEFVDWALDFHRKTHFSHQHCVMNVSIDIDRDSAHTESYYMAVNMNRSSTPVTLGGGRYVDRFERRDGRWKIAHRVCIRDWAWVDEIPDPFDQAALTNVRSPSPEAVDLLRRGPHPQRDRSDVSYERPLAASHLAPR